MTNLSKVLVLEYQIKNDNSKHYLNVDAYFGSTHSTSFHNYKGEVITITNSNRDGLMGLGKELKNKTITVVTFAQGDISDKGPDRLKIEYSIDDQESVKKVFEYDEPKSNDEVPFIIFEIKFL